MSHRLVFLVALTLVGSAGASHGSRDGSNQEFAKAMNTICVAGYRQAGAIGGFGTLADFLKKGPSLIAIDRAEVARIVKLGPPPARIAPFVADYLRLQRRINAFEGKALLAAGLQDGASVERFIGRAASLEPAQDATSRKIGATQCLSKN